MTLTPAGQFGSLIIPPGGLKRMTGSHANPCGQPASRVPGRRLMAISPMGNWLVLPTCY